MKTTLFKTQAQNHPWALSRYAILIECLNFLLNLMIYTLFLILDEGP